MSRADEFIREHTRNCSNLMQVPTLDDKGNIVPEAYPWLTPDQARRAVEIAREEIYEWIKKNIYSYTWCDYLQHESGVEIGKLIKDIKQAMKDE